jgi:hypothetical protein
MDVMLERSSSCPTSTRDKPFRIMLLLSMKSPSDDDEDEDNPATKRAKDLEAKAATRAKDVEDDVEEDNANASKDVKSPTYKSPTFDSPSPIICTISSTVLNIFSTTVPTIEPTAEPTAEATMEPTAVEVVQKWKEKRKATNRKAKEAKKTQTNKSKCGRAVNPDKIDGKDDSWEVLLLELKRCQVKLEQEKGDQLYVLMLL